MKSIILLHGAIGAKDQLDPLANQLSKNNFQVFSFSFSGHGKKPFAEKFGITQFAKELEYFVTQHHLIKPNIFGYSMGGYVALYLASKQPLLLGNIVTLGTKFNWTEEIAENEIKQLNPKTILEKVPKFADALRTRHREDWESVLDRTAKMMLELGEHNFIHKELLSKIENRVFLGLADNDAMVAKEETEFVCSNLKNGRTYILSNTKHPIETVNIEFLVENIVGFIT